MTRWLATLGLALATTACGLYGAPVRSGPPPERPQPEAPAEAPSDTAQEEETDP